MALLQLNGHSLQISMIPKDAIKCFSPFCQSENNCGGGRLYASCISNWDCLLLVWLGNLWPWDSAQLLMERMKCEDESQRGQWKASQLQYVLRLDGNKWANIAWQRTLPRETVNTKEKHVGLPIGASCHGNTRPPSPRQHNQIIFLWSCSNSRATRCQGNLASAYWSVCMCIEVATETFQWEA